VRLVFSVAVPYSLRPPSHQTMLSISAFRRRKNLPPGTPQFRGILNLGCRQGFAARPD
jgi:hypothetical protein